MAKTTSSRIRRLLEYLINKNLYCSSNDWFTIDGAARAELRKIEDDGEFWMPWTEFWKIFTDITICSYTPDFDGDGLSDGLSTIYFLLLPSQP